MRADDRRADPARDTPGLPTMEGSLHAQIDCASALLNVLGREHSQLVKREFQELPGTTREKTALLQRLDALGTSHRQLLAEAGVPPGQHPLNPSPEPAEPPELRPLGARLRGILAACKHQNDINGQSITAIRRFAQRALELLAGSAKQGTVYSRLGQARSLCTTRYQAEA